MLFVYTLLKILVWSNSKRYSDLSSVTSHVFSFWYKDKGINNTCKICLLCYLKREECWSDNDTCSLAHLVHSLIRLCFFQRNHDSEKPWKTDAFFTRSIYWSGSFEPIRIWSYISNSYVGSGSKKTCLKLLSFLSWSKRVQMPTRTIQHVCHRFKPRMDYRPVELTIRLGSTV